MGEMLADNLQSDGWVAELVRDGLTAIERLERGGVDVVVLDVMLPGCSGFDVLSQMRTRGDQTPVLILSARSDDQDRIRGLELKADDYLTKPFNLQELLLRVRGLLRRSAPTPVGTDTFATPHCTVDFRSHEATRKDGSVRRLTESEIKLLRLLSGRPGEVVTRKEILDHVFGVRSTASRTLDNLVLSLRRLLEADSGPPCHLLTIRGVGLRLVADPAAEVE